MNGLLEFVFEGVPLNNLAKMVMNYICEEENLSDAMQDGADLSRKSIFDSAYWENVASAGEDIACTVNLRTLRIGGKSIENATLQIIHYSHITDVSVLLSSTDCKKANIFSSEEFYQWAKEIGEKYGVDNFFGGLDPASDEHTQLFSKNGVGSIQKL